MKNTVWSVSSLVLLIAVAGCGALENMDKMLAATQSMEKKMDQTNQGLHDTYSVTKLMADQTDSLYVDQRQGFSAQIRHQFLESMERQSALLPKISEASQYYMAFEYQLYKNFGSDTEKKRDSLNAQAIEEFFTVIRRYIDDHYEIDVTSNDPRQLNAAALSVPMYRINMNLRDNTRVPDDAKLSMLDLIERALEKKAKVVSGEIALEDLKEHERIVLRYEQDAIHMLRLRTTFLGLAVLGGVTNIETASIFTKLWRILFSYSIDLKKRLWNDEEVLTNVGYINDAIREREFLKSQGVDPKVNKNLLKLYRHMKIKNNHEASPALKQLVDGINLYRN